MWKSILSILSILAATPMAMALMPTTAVAQGFDIFDAARGIQRLIDDAGRTADDTAQAVRRATEKAASESRGKLDGPGTVTTPNSPGGYPPLKAFVVSVRGDVRIQRHGSSTWVPLKEGDRLQDGDRVKSGLKSTAIVLVGGTQVYVKPLRVVTITKFLEIPLEEKPVERGGLSVNIPRYRPRIDMRPAPATKHSTPGG